jgi:DNA topoisomerase-1
MFFATEAAKNISDFGDGIKVLNGRYGPYITDGSKNAKIPKDQKPEEITHEQAKQMIADAPAAKTKGRFAKRTKAAPKAKKPATKKATAKKTTKPKTVKTTRTPAKK